MQKYQAFHKTGYNLTEGSIFKSIWLLALPMMTGNILQTLFNVVDMIFVGKLGAPAIAAVSMSGIIMMLIITVAIGLSIGTMAMVARFTGANDIEQANNVAMQSLILGGIIFIFLAIFGTLFAEPLLKLIGANPEVVKLGVTYLKIMFIGSITMLLLFLISAILRGAGDAVTPMKILIFSTILNIIVDPLLIFGIWIFPRLGVRGAAYATVFARGMGMVIGLWILFRGYSRIHVNLMKVKLDFNLMWRIIKIAIPGSIRPALRNISGLIVMSIVALYGTYAIAAYGICIRVNMIVMMPGFGLGAAAATLVGQNLGAKKPKRAERSAWITLGFYELIMVVVGALFFIFAQTLIKIFNTNPEVVRMGMTFLRIVVLSYIFLASSIILQNAMCGAGDAVPPAFITGITHLGVRVLLALMLTKTLGLKTMGVWLAIAISTTIEGILTAGWFGIGKWKYKKV
ncbi:MATE family efflux transporter [candidate division WOR-3 bacterium]|nr:MATE family efflux transporter [candidate division WOR-3 bacterium]